MTPLDRAGLRAAIREAGRGQGAVTNYHMDELCGDVFPAASSHASFVFLDRQPEAWRVFYISQDASDLRDVLSTVEQRPLLVDVLVRERPPYGLAVPQSFEAAGFQKLATYLRMRTSTLSARAPKRVVTPSGPELADAAWDLLCESFDPRLDHLMSRERLRELAVLGHVFAAGTPERVDAVCVYELEGSLCKWRFWAARRGAHPAAAVQVLGNWLADMAARGITRGRLWVDGAKTGPTATYERLGFLPDGVRAHIFALEAG